MKRLVLWLSVLLTILLLNGCSSNAEKNLDSKLAKYKECFINKDYVCMSSMVLPSIIQQAGGSKQFVEMMKALPETLTKQGLIMDASKMKFGKNSNIITQNDVLISIIPTEQPVVIQGTKGLMSGSIIAFSNDNGSSWFFLEGNDESKMMITDTVPELLQKINIPIAKLTLGNKTLIQQNARWVQLGDKQNNISSNSDNVKTISIEEYDEVNGAITILLKGSETYCTIKMTDENKILTTTCKNNNIAMFCTTNNNACATKQELIDAVDKEFGNAQTGMQALQEEIIDEPEVNIQSSPIRILAEKSYNQFSKTYIPQVVITSISDSVTIKNVLINKGNCKYSKQEWYYDSDRMAQSKNLFPKKLLYGKELKIGVSRCSILRVDVETNQGDWSVEY